MRAYVFVNVKAGKAKVVARQLGQLEGVKAADACWGMPDVIALIEVKNERALNDLVFTQISKMSDVERTDTHIALD
ncbi:MAG TPA: Lrp/AsnC ligand binding domain-containing protein [Candidatus Acidoferrales bacterium]|nr:Lrp/AsnC ligand binding domain-containing protein [Candidatus Acidoferrales bacterium]